MLCSHEDDGDRACSTKLLWTRVQGGVTKALAGTTLAELVEFSRPGGRSEAADRRAPPDPRPSKPQKRSENWLSWRYATCT